MKKLLFSAFDMGVGGIETSLLRLLNTLVEDGYDITLVLEKKQGIFLGQLDYRIQIIEYRPSESSVWLIRKIINLAKRIMFFRKHHNRYNFSASYATYSEVASFTARVASCNCALWGHADYRELFQNDLDEMKTFFSNLHYEAFRHYVFVSKASADSFEQVFPETQTRVVFCNNLIDAKQVCELAKETVKIPKTNYTFINVGRHDELQKKLTRIIEAAKALKQEGYDFTIWFIGEGEDTQSYKEKVAEHQLTDTILFLGVKKNPYPYLELADSVIVSSDYEGYPVIFLEAFVLQKPILTTDISDAKRDISGKCGRVVSKTTEGIYQGMKEFLEQGYHITNSFDAKYYNQEILQKIKQLIEKE